MGETPCNSLTICWKEHAECLHQRLWHSFKHDLLVDTNLRFYGNCIKAHRLVLSLFLPKFRRIALDGRGQELNLDYVANQIEDIEALIEFAYTGKVTIPEERLQSLRRLADELDFKDLAGSIADCKTNQSASATADSTAMEEEDSELPVAVYLPEANSSEKKYRHDEVGSISASTNTKVSRKRITSPSIKDERTDSTPTSASDSKQDVERITSNEENEDDDFSYLQSEADHSEDAVAVKMETVKSSNGEDDVSSTDVGGSQAKASAKRPVKRSKRWVRPTLKCPYCLYSATNNALLVTHLTDYYTKQTNDETPTRRRTRSQNIAASAAATTAATNTSTTKAGMTNVRPIRKRSKTATAASASVNQPPKPSGDVFMPESGGEDAEEKKRQRAEYQRNYRLARKVVKCNQCTYETRDPTALKAHRATHASPDTRQISCDKCQKTFLTLQALRFHDRTKCGKELRYTCNFCGHRTLHRETWRQHLANIHKRDTRGNPLGDDIKCSQCEYVCCARHQLQLHLLRKHTVDKPFKCDKCEYAAVRRSELAKHVSIQHLKERNYMCEICGFRSQTSNGLYSHLRSKHSGIKLYRCDFCGKEYNCHTSFKVHKQKHTGDVKLYVCHVCGHSCNKRTNLRSHMRRIHSVELESLKKNYAPREPHSEATEVDNDAVRIADDHSEVKKDFTTTILCEPTIGLPNQEEEADDDDDNSLSESNMVAVRDRLLHSVFSQMAEEDEPEPPV